MRELMRGMIGATGVVAVLLFAGCDGGGGDGGGGEDTVQAAEDTAPATDTAPLPEDTLLAEDTAPPPLDTNPAEDTALPPEDTVEAPTAFMIPISELSTTATFYIWEAPKATISFFAVLDHGDGIHVAFDACDVCYGAKKGYSQSGDKMVCNNCGNEFDITGIGTTNQGGGCWPGYLPITTDDHAVSVEYTDLEAGSWYFE